LKAGFGFPFEEYSGLIGNFRNFGSTWQDDKEIFELLVQHCKKNTFLERSLRYASADILGDQEFYLKCCDRSIMPHTRIPESLENDPDQSFLIALQGSFCPDLTFQLLKESYFNGDTTRGREILDFVQERVDLHKMFVSTFLPCMLSTKSVADTGSVLSLLNLGPETLNVYKRLIAKFANVATGKTLWRLRRAHRHVRDAMLRLKPWEEDATDGPARVEQEGPTNHEDDQGAEP